MCLCIYMVALLYVFACTYNWACVCPHVLHTTQTLQVTSKAFQDFMWSCFSARESLWIWVSFMDHYVRYFLKGPPFKVYCFVKLKQDVWGETRMGPHSCNFGWVKSYHFQTSEWLKQAPKKWRVLHTNFQLLGTGCTVAKGRVSGAYCWIDANIHSMGSNYQIHESVQLQLKHMSLRAILPGKSLLWFWF